MNGREAFARDFDVPRETLEKFDRFASLLTDAQTRFNLVANSTLPGLWTRHFADCAQLAPLASHNGRWLDLGSGAGLPGIVLALMGIEVDLVEATGKKADFLRLAIEALDLKNTARVQHGRAELFEAWASPTITARAFAPLARLLDVGLRFAAPETCWILPKGQNVDEEIREARQSFAFDFRLHPSRTSSLGKILIAQNVSRKASDAPVRR